ncbi:hypothetical protein [Serratia fonticola]|uniref:hypothetical protein n=1 Tax=Serratia fonticola TaxID=47917 RepID=UPI001868A3C9|nr:hypothetical protein [Serratia fonticola]
MIRKNKRITQQREITQADYLKCPDPIGTLPPEVQKRFVEEFRKVQLARQVERHE